jgi:oligopeptide/dipeptide ABC transporter ATP-binding protein
MITHDLGVVAETCDRVAVAYAGSIVEAGPVEDVIYRMKHPYTQGLLAALPKPSRRGQPLQSITGSVPSGLSLPTGCPFHPRCPEVIEVCRTEKPTFTTVSPQGHVADCHLYKEEKV